MSDETIQKPKILATQLNYKKYDYFYPVYKHSKILPLSGSQTVAVTNAGGAESLFEIPSKVFNLAQSYLNFTATPAESAVGRCNVVASDLIPQIRQIQLYTRGGLFLCDINNLDNYTKATLKADTKIEDFLTFDKMAPGTTYGNGLRPSSALANANLRYDGTNSSVSYLEPSYYQIGALATGVGPFPGNSPVLNYKINLGLIKNSIFSLDKNLFFDEVVVMRIIWNSPAKYIWTSNAINSPVGGGAQAYANGVTITNLQLYVAIETNQDNVDHLREQKNSPEGYSMLLPFVYGNKTNLNGNSQSISLRFNRAHGLRLIKVYHQPANNVENINSAYDTSNILGVKVSSFYTLLNNNRLQEFNIDCATVEEWMLMKEKIKGSVMLDSNVYQHNWVWIDDFSGTISPLNDEIDPDTDNFIKGIDLSTEQKYDLYLTTPGGGVQLNHHTFAVCQKLLVVSANGIQLM